MGKVGRWITDPKAGAYCTITLDSGEKIIINHDKGGFKGGRLTIERDTTWSVRYVPQTLPVARRSQSTLHVTHGESGAVTRVHHWRFVADPRGGGFCELDLDGSQSIKVSHQKMGSREGWLTIDMMKFMGASSGRVFALVQLTRDVPPENILATPLGAFVSYINDCWSVEEVQTKCRALMRASEPGRGLHGVP